MEDYQNVKKLIIIMTLMLPHVRRHLIEWRDIRNTISPVAFLKVAQ